MSKRILVRSAKARAAGCHDYVPKPFSPRQLNSSLPPITVRLIAGLGVTNGTILVPKM
jgi:hypothetical protein